jgi:hypothetical protein
MSIITVGYPDKPFKSNPSYTSEFDTKDHPALPYPEIPETGTGLWEDPG